jgi:hypothetical protein
MMRLAGGLLLVAVAGVSFGSFFLSRSDPAGAEPPTPKAIGGAPIQVPEPTLPEVRTPEPEPEPAPARDGFAADHEGGFFDGRRAMNYLRELCKIGPRISGTEGMRKQQEWLQKHFEAQGGRVSWQRFTAQQKSQAAPVDMANLIVSWHPDRTRRVILCSHYDTRPIADQEPDRRKWREPFVSANDGGSGVALLMELAQQMKQVRSEVGVDFVFFDGEEYIFNPAPGADRYFFGSEHFARAYRQDRPRYRYLAAVLLDMIGGKDAQFPIERNSWFKAAALCQELWQVAAEQRCAAFRNEFGPEVLDDHLALNRADIPAVDVIDFSYAHWHRLSDVPANCSAQSLEQVAHVLTAWLKRVK